jgi:hypothetical protein
MPPMMARRCSMLLMTFAKRYAMLCRRQGGDAMPHMTKRRTCHAIDEVCEERCYVMQKARRRCYAAHD